MTLLYDDLRGALTEVLTRHHRLDLLPVLLQVVAAQEDATPVGAADEFVRRVCALFNAEPVSS